MFTTEQQARKEQILKMFANGMVDEAQFFELKALTDAEAQSKLEREGDLVDIIKGISTIGMTFPELMNARFNEKPLFSPEVVLNFAREQGWMFKNSKAETAEEAEKKIRKQRTVREGLKLFEIQPPGARGAPATIFKGDTFPVEIGTKMVWLFQQDGDLEANLLNLKLEGEEVDIYLASDEGKAEVANWVNWIKENGAKALGTPVAETTEEVLEVAEPVTEQVADVADVAEEVSEEKTHGKKRKH